MLINTFFKWYYFYKKRRNSSYSLSSKNKKHWTCPSSSLSKPHFDSHKKKLLFYRLKSLLMQSKGPIALMEKPSLSSEKRAYTHPSYACNKPLFGKYDLHKLHFTFYLLGIISICLLMTWIIYESIYALSFFS